MDLKSSLVKRKEALNAVQLKKKANRRWCKTRDDKDYKTYQIAKKETTVHHKSYSQQC